MFWQILDIAAHQQGLYVLAGFWKTRQDWLDEKPVFLVNDFVVQVRRLGQRIVMDQDGNYKRLDGVFVAPENATEDDEKIGWERETFEVDVPARVRECLSRYARRAEQHRWGGDHTGTPGVKARFYRERTLLPTVTLREGGFLVKTGVTFFRDRDPQQVLSKASAMRHQTEEVSR